MTETLFCLQDIQMLASWIDFFPYPKKDFLKVSSLGRRDISWQSCGVLLYEHVNIVHSVFSNAVNITLA